MNRIFEVIILILVLYTIIVLVWETLKKLIDKSKGVVNEKGSDNSDNKQR